MKVIGAGGGELMKVIRGTDPRSGYEREITVETPADGVEVRYTKIIDPTEALRREVVQVLSEGVVGPEGPQQRVDVRQAVAVAVCRLLGIKLATPTEQKASELRLQAGSGTRRNAGQIGLTDLWFAVANWRECQRANALEGVKVQGAILPEKIRKAAQRVRMRFVLTEIGGTERSHNPFGDEVPGSDSLEAEFGANSAMRRFLAGLTSEQRAILDLKYRGYTRKAMEQKLGWSKQKVERISRQLAGDRAGGPLHAELVFWMSARHRQN